MPDLTNILSYLTNVLGPHHDYTIALRQVIESAQSNNAVDRNNLDKLTEQPRIDPDRVDWWRISMYQKLSEDFIREFADRVDWYEISACQKLSEDFIREFADRVHWHNISCYQKLSNEFKIEMQQKGYL